MPAVAFRIAIVTTLAVAGLGFFVHFAPGAGEEKPASWYPTDPELELLRLEFFGGMLGQQSRYSVYADGRLAIRRTSRDDLDIALTPEQLREFVATAVRGGMTAVTKVRQTELRNLARRYINSDAGAVRLTFHLPHFKASPSAEEREAGGQLALMKLGTYAAQFGEEPEVACIVTLTEELRALETQHRPKATS